MRAPAPPPPPPRPPPPPPPGHAPAPQPRPTDTQPTRAARLPSLPPRHLPPPPEPPTGLVHAPLPRPRVPSLRSHQTWPSPSPGPRCSLPRAPLTGTTTNAQVTRHKARRVSPGTTHLGHDRISDVPAPPAPGASLRGETARPTLSQAEPVSGEKPALAGARLRPSVPRIPGRCPSELPLPDSQGPDTPGPQDPWTRRGSDTRERPLSGGEVTVEESPQPPTSAKPRSRVRVAPPATTHPNCGHPPRTHPSMDTAPPRQQRPLPLSGVSGQNAAPRTFCTLTADPGVPSLGGDGCCSSLHVAP